MKYDAFISYRHGELDGLVAEKLHKMLETYRIPSAIAKKIGKKKLTRVFRDREELPTSSNLSDSINEALETSAYLLLICSRRTCQSQWVMREVERFGELHGKDKIITLLIDGEPDESFPPGLREREVGGETIFVEPLAADIRAETWAGSIKLLKEEKLRLLAPVLGCAFDDLRRRHRRRRIQRIASVVGAAFAFTLSFGTFSTWQYIQIDKQMQLKLENQSLVLAEYAAGELGAGDPETAIQLALAALPRDLAAPERPLVPAAEKALADALGVYDVADGFKPYKSVTLPSAPGKVLLSPDERYAAVIYPYMLAVYDTETGNITAQLPTVRSALADVEFLSDTTLVFSGEGGLQAYDIALGTPLWQGKPATAVSVSADGAVIAGVYKDEGLATLYAGDGQLLGEVPFAGKRMYIPADDSFINPHDTLFELNADGGRLACSFADGSLSVFDTQTARETSLYPAGNAIYFTGGFYGDVLCFAVVETEPYYSGFLMFNSDTGEGIARYESETSRFVPHAGSDGLYLGYDNQVMTVNALTGEVAHLASVSGRIETFKTSGDNLMICETGGTYSFLGRTANTYQSGYTCNFADIGARYALTGSYDSKAMRILRNESYSGASVLSYDSAYRFSEAKINPQLDRAVFYSYNGLRVCDMSGNVVAETEFLNPLGVLDTQYDTASGNVIVIYESAFRLYSGQDGGLLVDAAGKPGVKSVVYTAFGVSVLDDNDTVTLYDLSTGAVAATAQAQAERALLAGGLITVMNGRAAFNGEDIGAGELIGAGKTGDDAYAFAISDGVDGKVFTVDGGKLREAFAFNVRGLAEAYFCGGYAFISPFHGNAQAYTLDGAYVRAFDETGFLAEVGMLGDRIIASYVSSASERYSFLLNPGTLETVAYLPGYLGALDESTPVLDDRSGSLRSVRLHGTQELMDIAGLRLNGKTLSEEQLKRFKAG